LSARSSPALARWAPVVAWAALIFVASTSAFSGENTGAVVIPVLAWLFPHADPVTLRAAHAVIRKLAHFGEYWVLAVLLVRALRGDAPWSPRFAVEAIVLTALYAATDELHQRFVPGRTPAVTDVFIDTFGAASGQVLAAVRRLVTRA
jgi:VanZ family protein